MSKSMMLAALALLLIGEAQAQNQQRFYDAHGRSIGTATTDSQGTTTFRDAHGRSTGTATTDSQGTTTFRDSSGRVTGRRSAPAGRK
jgi:YD repeat-containing protein